MIRRVAAFAFAGCLAAAGTAQATYSIAAVDMSTGQVGGAITSCVGTLDVGIVYGSAPGKGVIHAQALLDQRGRAKMRAIELLEQGIAPRDIVMQLTAASFDASFESRQYGVVDLMGRASGFTGADAQAYRHDQQASVEPFAYSVQGNILTSQKVLDQASAAFEAQGCDLAEKLMLALEAGAKNGEGDSRCTDQGIPSDSAFIEVDLTGQAAGSYLKLSVMGTAPQSPLVALREQFDAWRKTHPCMANAGAAGKDAAAMAGAGGQAAAGRAAAAGREAAGTGAAAAGGNAAAAGVTAAADGGRSGAAGMSDETSAAAGTSAAESGATGVLGNAGAGSPSTHPSTAAVTGGSRASTGTPDRSSGGAAGVGQTIASATAATDQPVASASAAGCGCSLARSAARLDTAALALLALALVLRVRRRFS